METTLILKNIRSRRNITQEEMSNKLKISRQTYVNCENNILEQELSTVFNIFDTLGITDKEVNDFLNALKQDYISYKK